MRQRAGTTAARSVTTFSVLGPLLVDGADDVLVAGKQRGIVEVLVLRAPKLVSVDELRRALWGDHPPATADKTLQGLVSRLRRAVPDVVLTVDGGYRLDVDCVATDLADFEAGLAGARAALAGGEVARALELLDLALALWRHDPVPDLDADWAAGHRRRLDELRLGAEEDRVEALLLLGDAAAAVAEAEAAVAAEPLRERRWSLALRALAAAGRRADALRCFQRARAALADVGLEPGDELVRLEQAIARWGAGAAIVPAPPSADHRGVPAVARGIVGRADDLAALEAALAPGVVVTVTGPGGVGKTRAAVEVARRAPVATFVDLSSCHDEVEVLAAIAEVCGLDDAVDRTPLDQVRASLAGRPGLVVLDNCEQAVAPVAAVVSALAAPGSGSSFLLTSRSALGLGAERVVDLGPLEGDAVTLFVDRLAERDPTVDPGPDELDAIATICGALDGLPLALELGAGAAATIGIDRLRDRLADRFSLLTTATTDERHRSLEVVLGSSWDLLDPGQADLLDRCSVFAGPFSLEAAEVVLAGGETPVDEIYGALEHLVGSSLLTVEVTGADRRFRMLESVRLYAARRLVADGRLDEVRRRHLDRVLDLAARAAPELAGGAPGPWLDALGAEHDDLDAAFAYAATDPDLAGPALGAAVGLLNYWLVRGHRREVGVRWCTTLADAATTTPASLRTLALLHGTLIAGFRDAAMLRELATAAEAIAADGDDREAAAHATLAVAWTAMLTGAAPVPVEEVAAAASHASGPLGSWASFLPAYALAVNGHLDEAYRRGLPPLAAAETEGDSHMLAGIHWGMADISAAAGRPDDVRHHAAAALVSAGQAGCASCAGAAELDLVLVDGLDGDADNLEVARRAVQQAADVGEVAFVLWALDVLVGALARDGQDTLAVTIDAAVSRAREATGFVRNLPGREHFRCTGIAAAESRLSPSELVSAGESGATLDYADLVALAALSETPA